MRAALVLALAALACSGPSRSARGPGPGSGGNDPETGGKPPRSGQANPLVVDLPASAFDDDPRLLSRLLSGPHGYFRFVNLPFATEVCRRLADRLKSSPTVNLHGDAHVEQYAVTDLGRGLTDFDDSSRGPAAIDLIRFGVSLELAAAANGWSRHAPELIERFLAGYRAGLSNPELSPPAPAVASRFLQSFREDRVAAIEEASELMDPADFPRDAMQVAIDRYAAPILETTTGMSPGFFQVKRGGTLHLGIGSALDAKYLVLVEGPSEADDDDVVLEVKQVRKLDRVPCLNSKWTNDPFRILVGSARIAYQPFRYLGYTLIDGAPFWVHAWTDNYFQVVIDYSLRNPRELAELAFDVGVQLGRGHPHLVASPLDAQLREALLRDLDEHRQLILREIDQMTELTRQAWKAFSARITSR